MFSNDILTSILHILGHFFVLRQPPRDREQREEEPELHREIVLEIRNVDDAVDDHGNEGGERSDDETPRVRRDGGMPRMPPSPAPRIILISTVSAWSSNV